MTVKRIVCKRCNKPNTIEHPDHLCSLCRSKDKRKEEYKSPFTKLTRIRNIR